MKNPLVTTSFGPVGSFLLLDLDQPYVFSFARIQIFMERTAKIVYAFEYHKLFVDPKINNLLYFLLLCVKLKTFNIIRAVAWFILRHLSAQTPPYLPDLLSTGHRFSLPGNKPAFSMSIRCQGLRCMELFLQCSLHLLTSVSAQW
jgi:hypothetical protein